MQGEKFDVGRVEESLESVFIATTARRDSGPVWLGSSLSKMLLERQRDHVQSVQAFVMALKVRIWIHPLTIIGCLHAASMRTWLISMQIL